MWIDMMVAFEPGHRLTAVKNVSLAEDHLHDHFADQPIMPASLMLEGMAQTAGVLVGSTRGFKEKVILAKIGSATIDADVIPGQTIRYDAVIERVDESGASTKGTISCFDHRTGAWTDIGSTEIVFSHIDNNRSGVNFPKENFVFGENFKRLLNAAGLSQVMTAAGVTGP
jgi:3-hydroxyacyl-[acyl-carrier-protein] dehydratase